MDDVNTSYEKSEPGAIISVVNIIIWLGIGGLWWKLLRLW